MDWCQTEWINNFIPHFMQSFVHVGSKDNPFKYKRPQVYTSVNWVIIGPGNATCSGPNHKVNQWWFFVKRTLRNILDEIWIRAQHLFQFDKKQYSLQHSCHLVQCVKLWLQHVLTVKYAEDNSKIVCPRIIFTQNNLQAQSIPASSAINFPGNVAFSNAELVPLTTFLLWI